MQLLDELLCEHDLIDRLLGTLRAYAARFARGEVDASDGFAMIDVFETYVGGWHHEREETVLFRALVDAQLPGDRGPIAALLADHAGGSRSLAAMRDSLRSDPAEFERIACEFSQTLWAHIDAENSVLFPEGDQHLQRNHVRELPLREMAAEIREAEERAEVLIQRYGAGFSADVVRGDGCAMCPAYGDSCGGVEREWWNEWQWEELDEHIASS